MIVIYFEKIEYKRIILKALLDQKPPRGAGRAMLFYESS